MSVSSDPELNVSSDPELSVSPAPELTGCLSIGQVVDQLQEEFPGLTGSKIRFLEERKLMSLARSETGHRIFSSHDVAVLRWILTCQRDQYLPLNVIAGRLERGEHMVEIWGNKPGRGVRPSGVRPSGDQSYADQPIRTITSEAVGLRNTLAAVRQYTEEELCAASDLSSYEVAELIEFGILSPLKQPRTNQLGAIQPEGTQVSLNQSGAIQSQLDLPEPEPSGPRFCEGAIELARIAREFSDYGLKPRHLRIMRNAATRDAEMLLQGLQPVVHASTTSTTSDPKLDARRSAERLLGLCDLLRSAYMRDELAQVLE